MCIAGYPSVGVTTGGHSVTASKTTISVTRPTVGNHIHQPTGAAYGGHSLATSKTAHQSTGIAKPSVREDHSTSEPDQGNIHECVLHICDRACENQPCECKLH